MEWQTLCIGYDAGDGCFTHTTRPHNGNNAAATDIHADVIQHDFVIALKVHVLEANYWVFQSVVPVIELEIFYLVKVLTVKHSIVFHDCYSLFQCLFRSGRVFDRFFRAKKNEGSLRFPRRRSVGTPLAVDCRSS